MCISLCVLSSSMTITITMIKQQCLPFFLRRIYLDGEKYMFDIGHNSSIDQHWLNIVTRSALVLWYDWFSSLNKNEIKRLDFIYVKSYSSVVRNSIYGNHTHILNNRSVLIRTPAKATYRIARFHMCMYTMSDTNKVRIRTHKIQNIYTHIHAHTRRVSRNRVIVGIKKNWHKTLCTRFIH